ncbi:disrupted in schizophrenia 1 protein isoform X1 [Colossoma macropomum]|uniref:disrupted in schizophrenia 1 protein isoform X1 n=1 Tax=Colossoma macropomum TaxID=42526 RepID=UPI0018654399|nr:disrupted in schizophrenia 1 protein isoform X1 [Colossoma macropomum]
MFSGMVKLRLRGEGGLFTAPEVDVSHRRSLRTTNLSRHLDCAACLAGRVPCLLHHHSEAQASCPSALLNGDESAIEPPDSQGHHGEDSAGHRAGQPFQDISSPQWRVAHQPEPRPEQRPPSAVDFPEDAPSDDTFNSSFSFIQQSLDSERSFWDECDCETSKQSRTESAVVEQSVFRNEDAESSRIGSAEVPESDQPPGQSGKPQNLLLDDDLLGVDLDAPWHSGDRSFAMTSHSRDNMPDSDTEVTSSLSVDSSDSASSSTSGYESATPSSDQRWDILMNKCEGILQECLQENRTNSRIESMMFKLQRLQQKAVLDDDYDTAERFSKKLDELMKEKASLKPGLPSRHPKVTSFLERLRTTIQSALRRTDPECRPSEESSESRVGAEQSREQLLQERELIQREMAELQLRLEELQKRSLALEEQLTQEELRLETVEMEGTLLRGCSPAQLQLIGRALEDLITSKHRVQISLSPVPSLTRLQEQEQSLTSSIKEATAKVVMSQRLGGSLRRKVSESETQLLALHEAKLAAISGSDFSTAKELKAEMRSVYEERDHLEGLAKRLQTLSAGSAHDLARMKEQHSQLKKELQKREAQYEQNLKENIVKYTEFLEDRLHSCGSPALERIWEADLEACHLLLRGLQLHTPTYSEPEDLPSPPKPCPQVQPFSKMEADCAMLTALGGCWGSEVNLQNSEFTKKLEEFLFCLEDGHPEDLHSEAVELTERCELISERLLSLEEQLQTALQNSDQDITVSLEKEVQEVKATLQDMLSQLKKSAFDEEEEEQEDEEQFHDVEDGETLEVEEDNYFSDSWEI